MAFSSSAETWPAAGRHRRASRHEIRNRHWRNITNLHAPVAIPLDIEVRLSHIGGTMKASDADILIIPGYTNSGPGHWQSRWEAKLSTARR
ncbi:alpha/beta hydrolase, partial [Rhizobium ruizarguesonis]